MTIVRRWVFGLGLLCAGQAMAATPADEAKVRQLMQSRFPQGVIEGVTRAPLSGLYEVVLDGEIVYTDEAVNYLFGGNIYDVRKQPPKNLTQERTEKVIASTLENSRELAIKRVRGNGRRVLYTFEDPNCGYCKALQKEMVKLNDVTIYTFLMPILSQDSVDKSTAVWCARDRLRAWDQLMTTGAMPDGARNCDTPHEKVSQIARRFSIRGTPAIYTADGRHVGGMRPAAELDKLMNAVAAK